MQRIPLKPVDGVHVTTLIDNSCDVLLPDEGLVRRWGPIGTAGAIPVIPSDVAEGGKSADFLRAEHGFVRHAKQLTGVDRAYAVLGGFHLTGGLFEPIIPQTVAALAAEAPDVLVPAHCTGWKAQHALASGL